MKVHYFAQDPDFPFDPATKPPRKNFDNYIFRIDAYPRGHKKDPLKEFHSDNEQSDFLFNTLKSQPVECGVVAFFARSDTPIEAIFAFDENTPRYTLLLRFKDHVNRRGRLSYCLLNNGFADEELKVIISTIPPGKKWEDLFKGQENQYLYRKKQEIMRRQQQQSEEAEKGSRKKMKTSSEALTVSQGNIEDLQEEQQKKCNGKTTQTIAPHEERNVKIIDNTTQTIAIPPTRAEFQKTLENLLQENEYEFRRIMYELVNGRIFLPLPQKVHQVSSIKDLQIKREMAKQFELNAPYPSMPGDEDKTKTFIIDCEMATYRNKFTKENLQKCISLAIVNLDGKVLFDRVIKPIRDQRTYLWRIHSPIHGITEQDLKQAIPCEHVQGYIERILNQENAVIIGFALQNDINALNASGLTVHPKKAIDIQKLPEFQRPYIKNQPVGLAQLVAELWGSKMPYRHHAVSDARTTLLVYNLFRSEIEANIPSLLFRKEL